MFLNRHLLYCVACYCALLVRVALQLTDSLTQFARRCRLARFSTHDPLQFFLQGQLNIVTELEGTGFLERCGTPRVLLCVMGRTGSDLPVEELIWSSGSDSRKQFSFFSFCLFKEKKLKQSCCVLVNMSNMKISPFTRQTCQRKKLLTWGNKSTNKAATPLRNRSSVFFLLDFKNCSVFRPSTNPNFSKSSDSL